MWDDCSKSIGLVQNEAFHTRHGWKPAEFFLPLCAYIEAFVLIKSIALKVANVWKEF